MYDPIHKTSKLKDYFFPAAILLTGITISIAIFWNKGVVEKTAPGAILPVDFSDSERVQIEINSNDPILGNPQAQVAIVEFYDFQCEYCKLFAEETLPKIIENYVKPGKIKFIFKDFAYLGDDSINTAIAANCAFEQNKFLEYHNGLFAFKNEDKSFSQKNILALAKKLNLNIFKFNDCIGLQKNKDKVEKVTKEGRLKGVRGTPTFFINGIKIYGAQDFYAISSIIDQELKTKK